GYRDDVTDRNVFNEKAAETMELAAASRIDLFLPDWIPDESPSTKTCVTDGTRIRPRAEANPYCLLPWFHAIIDWNGDYRVCSLHTLGNLRNQSFDEIYGSPKMQEIKSKMFWRTEHSCSWDCHQEAYDVPEEVGEA